LLEMLRRTFGACRRHVPVGSSVFSAEQVRFWRAEGVAYFLCGTTSPIRTALGRIRTDFAHALALETAAGPPVIGQR
jgi:hypothetical protein